MAKHDGFTKISSGHIAGCKYDSSQRKMIVRFQNGYCYTVHGISAGSYQQFLEAPSQGTHWHENIKDQYHITREK
jgi:hypothetical protein